MILYRFEKKVASNYHNLLSSILQTVGEKEFEIDCRDLDFYLTDVIVPHKVYDVQEPRLDKLFGSYQIPGRVKLRGEWRSYVSQKFNRSTGIIHAKRFYKDRLIEECWYSYISKYVVKHIYYGHNPKLDPTVTTMESEGNVFTYKRHYNLLGKNDYDKYILNMDENTISSECKRTRGKDWYEISTSTETVANFLIVHDRTYKFDYHKFMRGEQYYGFIPKV